MLGENVAQGHEFIFCNHKKAHNLEEFKEIVENLEENEFCQHVNENKNDFANWITWAFRDETLGDKINNLKTKEEIVESINNSLMGKNKDGIKEGTADDEWEKEELKETKEDKTMEEKTEKFKIKPETTESNKKVVENLIKKEKTKIKAKEFLIIEFVIGLIIGLVIGIILGMFVL